MSEAVREKKEAFQRYLGSRRDNDWERYKERKREVKRKVREAKEKADERWSRKIVECFREKSKMFWKEVNKVRNKKEELSGGVKGADGEMVQEDREVRERWREYFKNLLNVNRREVERGRENGLEERRVGRSGVEDEVDGIITKEEIKKAIRKIKKGKAAGMDGIHGEML